tara:strand:- start:13 stop:1218 length:1206 start_codon:yes stop_codon:yes gene_type:complete
MRGFEQARLDRIAPWMQSYVESRRFAGCTTLIAHQGREVYFHKCGLRDVERGLPWERDTVARIYSMTKPVATVAMMMQVEKGLCHLDAPVSDFIPAFAEMQCLVPGATTVDQVEPCAVPTLHQLLTHTSGLSYTFNPGPLPALMTQQGVDFQAANGTLGEMCTRLAALPLAFHPGSRWEYSVGIDVIGHVVEVITGRPLDDVLTSEIFDPLGMSETRFSVPDGVGDRFAALYTPLAGNSFDLNAAKVGGDTLRLADDPVNSRYLDATLFSGGGGLVGTIDDYLKFAEMLRTGGQGLLSPHTLSFMMRNHLTGDIASLGPSSFAEQPMEGMGFGLGGAVVLDPGRARVPGSVGDFSWGGMASTFFWVDRTLDLSVVFFTQLSPSSSYPSRSELKALVHGALM